MPGEEKARVFWHEKAYNPVKIVQADWSGKGNGYLLLQIENRYDFTSLKDVAITAAFDEHAPQQVKAAIPPHGKGTIRIPLKKRHGN
ncbi:DUF4981 domain-containing protein [Niabella hibiscisoli]|uniref:DUF4981 domain-containing protein n=1 Tax=Niabella hibiscisoli TaxID=1825928 RepID=UPI001F10507A|nr:DUF4981 domain-containing protein [Niabella hibiscisoli]MCH5719248.1 DUF4981 domain-containing protein [Niabella hibiscisoli]